MDKLAIQDTQKGPGVFAVAPFEKGECILKFVGPTLDRSEVPFPIIKPEEDRYLQISKDSFIGPADAYEDFLNHSCELNSAAIIKDTKAQLIALETINPDTAVALFESSKNSPQMSVSALSNSA